MNFEKCRPCFAFSSVEICELISNHAVLFTWACLMQCISQCIPLELMVQGEFFSPQPQVLLCISEISKTFIMYLWVKILWLVRCTKLLYMYQTTQNEDVLTIISLFSQKYSFNLIIICLSRRQVQPEYSDLLVLQSQGQRSSLLYRPLCWKGTSIWAVFYPLCIYSLYPSKAAPKINIEKSIYHLVLLYDLLTGRICVDQMQCFIFRSHSLL